MDAEFSAWCDRMPGPATPRLHVSGWLELPTPGYEIELSYALQGINPRELILNLDIVGLPGVWPEVVTKIAAHYQQAGCDYDSILIRWDDESRHITDIPNVEVD